MNIRCIVRSHQGSDYGVWNQGYCFSHCSNCGCDLIRSSGGWRTVPTGHRVVWRFGHDHSHAIPSTFRHNLPLVVTSRPWWKFSWRLGLHRRGVGCIMLPSDPAYQTVHVPQTHALAHIVTGALVVMIQAILGPARQNVTPHVVQDLAA